ncbi:hypothetical protein [Kaistia terrae]|uniref:Glycosyltransferase RgtA/B/C/D-like domain-containing protein n=1 Tax=Kaistia terrae TaxID=537017 RepID=A0ABW0Q066_9HYPH|nr:hypothetical protein [Kaistia terrae]MCX5578955.1 hypothetical protein [Kaistia terrae]
MAIALQMVAWSALLQYNLPRAQATIEAQPALRNFLVMSADFGEYRDYYRDYPKHLGDITRSNIFNEYYKRPAYGPISGGLSFMLSKWPGIDYPRSMFLILSFYASLAGTLFFWLMRRTGLDLPLATTMTAIGVFSFGWLSVFSVPESYSLAVCGILACLLSGSSFVVERELRPGSAVRHAVVAGLSTWLYLPAAAATVLLLPALRSRRQWITVLAPALAIAAVIGYGPHLLYQGESAQLQLDYAKKWMTLGNFIDPATISKVFFSFIFFSIVAPVPDFVAASPDPSIRFAGTHWLAVCLLGAQAAFLIYLTVSSHLVRIAGVAAFFAILMAFHIYFNPHEVLLYLSPIVPVLLLGTAMLLVDFLRTRPQAPRLGPRISVGLFLFAALLSFTNLRATLGI